MLSFFCRKEKGGKSSSLGTDHEEKGVRTDWVFYLLVVSCLAAGFLVDNTSWLVVASAVLIPVLFLWLIFAYTKADVGSVKLSLIWGVLGFAMLLFAIYANPMELNPHIISVLVNLSCTLISLSVIGVILQLKDTKEYFALALSDLIMKEGYVAKLSKNQLEKLQKTVLERYFENSSDFNRENSFYKFFGDNIRKYIGSPYRENYRNTISVSVENDSSSGSGDTKICKVTDDLTYQIRCMGPDLQKEIRWSTAKDEVRHLSDFVVKIGAHEIFSFPAKEEGDTASDLIDHNFHENPENGFYFLVNLESLAKSDPDLEKEYKDGAVVKISAKYSVTEYNSITTKLLFPTKGFSLSVFHDKNLRCKIDSFGFDSSDDLCEHNKTSQGFTFHYPGWILPFGGAYVTVEEVDLIELSLKKINQNNSNEEGGVVSDGSGSGQ